MRAMNVLAGVGIGALITPVAAMSAMISGGAGHGHYEFARLFFPYTMLLTRFAGETVTGPLIGLALAQFPAYGAVIGITRSKPSATVASVLLVVAHTVAVVLCFSGVIPNFS